MRKSGHEIMQSVHRTLWIISVAVPLLLLVCFLVRYPGLPEQIGVHFEADGQFDLIDRKFYGFYAWLIILITQGIVVIIEMAVPKVRSGLRLGEKGEELFRDITLLWMDLISLGITAFFCTFGACVTWQRPYPVSVGRSILVVWLFLLLLYPAGAVLAKIIRFFMKLLSKKED